MLNKWGISNNWPSTLTDLKSQLQLLIDSSTYNILRVDNYLPLLLNWSHYSRGYHGFNHLREILSSLNRTSPNYDKLVLITLTHDIVYDTTKPHGWSEAESAKICKQWCSDLEVEDLSEIVEWTSDYLTERESELFNEFKQYDLAILNTQSIPDFIEYELGIRWEWRWVPYATYRQKRIEVLDKLLGLVNNPLKLKFIEWIERRRPQIAFFAGSFNPFHIGHEWILKAAEFQFDECILARGVNPDKAQKIEEFNIPGRWCRQYSDLLIDEIERLKSEGVDLTLVRGLRNSIDLEYEKSFWKWNDSIGLDIKTWWIITPPELTHISSSAIRGIDNFCETSIWTKLNI